VVRELDANNAEWKFEKSRSLNANGNGDNNANDTKATTYKVTLPEGDVTTYSDVTDANGTLYSVITLPNGRDSYVYQTNKDGTESNLTIDQTFTSTQTQKDPLTLNTILKSRTVKTPSGLTNSLTQSIVYNGDVANLTSKTTKLAINGKTTTITENYQDARITIASPSTYIKQTIDYDKETGLTKSYQYATFTPIAYEYDNKGRLTKQKQGDIDLISFAYNTRGSISSITDSNAQTTAFTYDKLDRVTSVTYPNGARESYEYDSEGNVVKFRTPKETTFSFAYNPLNLRTLLGSPQSKTTRYTYNKNRQPLSIEYSSGKKVLYNYDQGQLNSIKTNEGEYNYDYSFYNKVSSVTRVDKTNQSSNPLLPANETISCAYDGNLITSIAYQGAINETIGFTYNNDFNPTSITYGEKTDSYTYNNDNLLARVGNWDINRDSRNGICLLIGLSILYQILLL
jgi:YD repeat-containing protein